jgi:N-carbamoyl-L-amino-acid hydrolase
MRAAAAEAWALMRAIGELTREGEGITRAAFGAGEQVAAEQVADFIRAKGLALETDAFGNMHVLLPGQQPELPAIAAGSHLDSVPQGGNYDGLAGVVAALAVLVAVRDSGARPRRSLRAIILRGEESPWFGTAYIGSRLMLGRSTMAEIGGLVRFDSGRTLAQHLAELGFADAGRQSRPVFGPRDLAGFFELHIEQGPLLEGQGIPIGVATGLRGNVRFPEARCFGEYGHASAVPRAHRRDAVVALSELVLAFDAFWAGRVAQGDDNFVYTVGKVATDPAQHAMTKVPGEVRFSFNFGATVEATLTEARALLERSVREIEQRRGVRFDLGTEVGTPPVAVDEALMGMIEASAAAHGLASLRLPTVGHDTAMFALSGIPAAMVMVRNAHGSHNPRESMEEADFTAGVITLAGAMERAANAG